MTRRTFLHLCLGLAGCAIPLKSTITLAVPPKEKTIPASNLSPLSKSFRYENVRGHIGESFSVYGLAIKGVGKVVSLKLVEVTPYRIDQKTEQFWVRFSGPGDYPLPSGIYTFKNAADEFELLIKPEKHKSGPGYYLAEFNLLLERSR